MNRVIVSLPEEYLEKIDEVAATEHRSRSELIREALREYLTSHAQDETEKRLEAARIMDEARKKSGSGKVSGAEIISRWRYRLAK